MDLGGDYLAKYVFRNTSEMQLIYAFVDECSSWRLGRKVID
jgi:hypothetical protein